ncbi:MAG: beta-ketoacyl synthase chain length factor [Vicingaceae bacterium]|nr:beta-ketoacyl synthase chain length factor [Vicingaceae bacterium]
MLYIHSTSCISAQHTFDDVNFDVLNPVVENKLVAVEPNSNQIPNAVLRRMGKAVRMGIKAALSIVNNQSELKGIIIGTANGGMEDCIKFLNQIIDYDEGTLTPTNFVQSTANNIAAQIGLFTSNKNYNITHVHRGLAFENAVIDAMMLVKEHPNSTFLLGGVDEISTYNYTISLLDGLYKNEEGKNNDLYETETAGSVAGEGAAMFLVNGKKQNAQATLKAIQTIHTTDEITVEANLKDFLATHLADGEKLDLFLSGENGDSRLSKYTKITEKIADITTLRYKHLTGEFPTASALSLWFACNFIETQKVPTNMVKSGSIPTEINTILIYNNYTGIQHSFMLVSR